MKDYRYFGNITSTTAIIFVGGFGDNLNTFKPLINQLIPHHNNKLFITFSFPQPKTNNSLDLQSEYLLKFVDYVVKKYKVTNLILICTSDGAFSTTFCITKGVVREKVSKTIFLDPANYYLAQGKDLSWNFLWPGYKKYTPKYKTLTDLLKTIDTAVKIDVINFTLKNYSSEGYPKPELRGFNNPKLYPRINNSMVKSFYTNTPVKNRGAYKEVNTVPHAFMRDGNVVENIKILTDLLNQLL